MTRDSRPIVHVHHRGDRGVDGILRLIELASHDGPLETMLTAMADEVAAIMGVEIASVYVAETTNDADRLVMRGNHGFPATAIGATALHVGEGLTGLVAECMRPVSAAEAAAESAYKHVPGLGEERFPVFAGIPLISGGAVVGVLVVQRRTRPFGADEVTLATALGAPITLAVERRRASALRSARLTGTAAGGGGIVLGRAGIVPTTTAVADALRAAASVGGDAEIEVERIIGRLRDDLGRALKKLADIDDAAIGAVLDRFSLALCDQRLRERLIDAAAAPNGLRGVAKDYVRASVRLSTIDDGFDIDELCALVGMTADPRAAARTGAVWIADRVGSVMTIAAVARGAAALVTADAASPEAIAIARAAGLPLVTGVAGVFGWARSGDLLAVDGASGTVLVHPAASEIERLRRERADKLAG